MKRKHEKVRKKQVKLEENRKQMSQWKKVNKEAKCQEKTSKIEEEKKLGKKIQAKYYF